MNRADPHVVEGVDRLAGVIDGLASIAFEHPKCLRCHCYREVAEQAAVAATGAGVGRSVVLLDLLAGTEAGHG